MLPELNRPKELSAAIKQARQARHMTQEELASRLGVSPNQVAAYESFGKKGFTPPRPAIYQQLVEIFDGNGVGQRTVGKRVDPLAVKDATDEELIQELKSRGVGVFKFMRG